MEIRSSQNRKIKAHLLSGKSLTALEALKLFDCMRLASRIWDLRVQGLEINKQMITRNGKRFAQYSLSKG